MARYTKYKRNNPSLFKAQRPKAVRKTADGFAGQRRTLTCFNCRQEGHAVQACPNDKSLVSKHCYKCGASEHTSKDCHLYPQGADFKFAKCFLCQETGHLASQCPTNDKGLYPNGGGCRVCGSVRHFAKDCDARALRKKSADETMADEAAGSSPANAGADNDEFFDELEHKARQHIAKKGLGNARHAYKKKAVLKTSKVVAFK